MLATTSELTTASRAWPLDQASSYHLVVKPSQGSEMIEESLKENRRQHQHRPEQDDHHERDQHSPRHAGQPAADAVTDRSVDPGGRARLLGSRGNRGSGHGCFCERGFHQPACTSCHARS